MAAKKKNAEKNNAPAAPVKEPITLLRDLKRVLTETNANPAVRRLTVALIRWAKGDAPLS